MKERVWVLKNPRSHVYAASITEIKACGGIFYILYVGFVRGSRYEQESFPSLLAAKMAFSKCVIQPKHWGKNIWEEQK